MALVSMFLCNQSYASHGRDFLLGATILNFNGMALDRGPLLNDGTTLVAPSSAPIGRYPDGENRQNTQKY